ncbi:uncharacterized protein J3R85_003431 [Psidium guajava]|nr:uncharacterized protein J3R85_003431 [Psidium guajava]
MLTSIRPLPPTPTETTTCQTPIGSLFLDVGPTRFDVHITRSSRDGQLQSPTLISFRAQKLFLHPLPLSLLSSLSHSLPLAETFFREQQDLVVNMEASSESSTWADQWDHTPKAAHEPKRLGGSARTDRYKQKVGEGLAKTKTVASRGVNKVKEGTTVGFQWLKDKYRQTTRKH